VRSAAVAEVLRLAGERAGLVFSSGQKVPYGHDIFDKRSVGVAPIVLQNLLAQGRNLIGVIGLSGIVAKAANDRLRESPATTKG